MILKQEKINVTGKVIEGNGFASHNTILRFDYKILEELCFNSGGPFQRWLYRVKHNGEKEVWMHEKFIKDIK